MAESTKISAFNGKSDNLQMLRFIAAVLVVFNHSFILSTGSPENEWFVRLTNGQYTFGSLAVSFFFFCSGFYAMRTISTKSYSGFKLVFRRYLRLIKPLIPVVVLCIAVGGVISELTLREYYANWQTLRYLLNGLLVLQHDLPGVFQNNIYVSTVNGSLWTLPVEFACFVLCTIGYKLSLLNEKITKFIFLPLLVIAIALKHVLGEGSLVGAALLPASIFFVGMVYYIYRDWILLSIKWFVVCLAGIVLLGYLGLLEIGMIFLFPYICAFVCFHCKQVSSKLGRLGDISYEMYLWGFPVQQFVIDRFGGSMNSYVNFAIAVPVVVALAGVMKMVERKWD